jgi:hypothetical protein
MTHMVGHKSWCGEDISDAKEIGRSSRSVCSVRLDLIGGEDVAKLPLCDAVFGEEDDACLLCFLSHEGVWWRGLFRSWAGLATWVATWLRWPGKVSLSPFLISGFFFLCFFV